MPVFFAHIDVLFIALMSWTISTISPGFLNECMYIISPRDPSVKAGENTGILFYKGWYKSRKIYFVAPIING